MVEKVVARVHPKGTGQIEPGPKIRLKKWVVRKGDLELTAQRLRNLKEALVIMLEFMNAYVRISSLFAQCLTNTMFRSYLESLVAKIGDDRTPASPVHHERHDPSLTEPATGSFLRSPLKCLAYCYCRCHSSSVHLIIPPWLSPYIGQIFIPKRLIYSLWASQNRCNVQTCRGTSHGAMTIRWIMPPTFIHGYLHSTHHRRIHFAICAPRTIPWTLPIFEAIYNGDLRRVRDLFAMKQASIWDYDIYDRPVFSVSGRILP